MSLVKLKNNGQTILFVDSLGITLRPVKSPQDFILFDENAAKNDPELARCILNGLVSVCGLDEDFFSQETAKTVEKKSTKKTTTRKKASKRKTTKSGKAKRKQEQDPEDAPPIVMFGEIPTRVKTRKTEDIPLPDVAHREVGVYSPDEFGESPEDGDIQPGDIVYADEQGVDGESVEQTSRAVVMTDSGKAKTV